MYKSFKLNHGILISLFLVLVIFSVYGQVGRYGFVDYDDDQYVFENPHVEKGLTTDNLIWALTSGSASNWHPLTWLSHMTDVWLYGMSPGRHHITSLLFHIINSLLLFVIFKRMTGELWTSAFVAVCFALHPLNVQSVVWISERKNVLSTFFFLLSMGSYVVYARRPCVLWYLPVSIFFIFGLMSKPMLVTLPFVFLLLDLWPLRRFWPLDIYDKFNFNKGLSNFFHLFAEKLPLFLLSAVSCAVTFLVQRKGGAVGSLTIYPFAERFANALVSYIWYIQKTIWPTHLAVFYPYPAHISGWQVGIAAAILICVTFFAARSIKKYPWFCVGWLWYLGTLMPVIGLVQVGLQARADRYAYIPLIGLFVIVAWGTPVLLTKSKFKGTAIISACTIVIVLMIHTSRAQVHTWKNSSTLFKHALAVTSDNFLIENNLAFYLIRQGKGDEAVKYCRKAISVNPNFEPAYVTLGNALRLCGRTEECIEFYKNTLKKYPDFAGIHLNLGNAFFRKGEIKQAMSHFIDALRIRPNDAEIYNSLGAAMVRVGKFKTARRFFRQAIRINPDYNEAKKNLKKLL